MKNKLINLLLVLNVLLVIITFCSYFAPNINPKVFWIFSFLGLFFPIFVFLNILMMILWMFIDAKYVSVSLLALILGGTSITNYFGIHTDEVSNNPHNISLISFNIGNALEAYDTSKEIKANKLSKMNAFLERFNDEDIICLQEVGSYASDVISKNFKTYNIHKISKGTVILSKHKILKKGLIEFGTKTNSCLWADILVGIDTVRVYNLHLQSNRITNKTQEVIANRTNDEYDFKSNVLSILKRYKNYHLTRTDQALSVKEHADASPHRVMICGDFNDVPLSYNYHILQEGLVDAFKAKGEGLGSTFNGVLPFLRIDYILANPTIDIVKFNVIKEVYSDHYPVAAVVALR
jgi:endonuclease/exonuclease/phosphatase family metal-dependent hydrolase